MKILEQKIIGYSEDFKKTYIQHKIKLTSGEVKIMYSTDTVTEHGVHSGEMFKTKPYVARPA